MISSPYSDYDADVRHDLISQTPVTNTFHITKERQKQ